MQKFLTHIAGFLCVAAIMVFATISSSHESVAETSNFVLTANILSSLGTITINETGGATYNIDVSAPGTYTQSVDHTVVSITVAGVTVTAGTNTSFDHDGKHITVTWVSPLIVVVDQKEL